jgi:Family of unknown function (DUF5677)
MTADLAAELRLALEVCKDVQARVESMLDQVHTRSGEQFKLLMMSKALRARALFLGVISLAEQRLASPASALIRCLMELNFVALALAQNPEWVSDLIDADETNRVRAMRRLLSLPDEHRAANVSTTIITDRLQSISPEGSGVQIVEWAKRANREDEYKLAYMLLSGDVHPSLRGAEAHLVLDADGKACGLSAYPGVDELPFRLMHACDSYLTIISALPDGILSEGAISEVEVLYSDERKRAINQRALDSVEARDFGG